MNMLTKSEIEQILVDWNYWQNPPKTSIPRKVLHRPLHLAADLVWVIQGVRRCGKSTLLAQIMTKTGLDPQDCTFINFEDPRLSDDLTYHTLDAVVAYAQERRAHTKRHYFFFDEIQHVAQWQKWLHRKLERPSGDTFVITGSNAALLSGDLASALTGRHRTLELFPFDLEEFRALYPNSTLEEYLARGGFPRILIDTDPENLLREYFTDIIERDVRRHVSVRSALPLVQLVKAVFESAGSEISQRRLAKMLDVSTDTMGGYLDACEAAYLILPCPYFTFSERQRVARNRKYYPIDLGLRRAVITRTGLDQGKALETLVYLKLREKYRSVYYWRQKGEVDFVTMGEDGIVPYQVSWEGAKPRHDEALSEFYEAFPQARRPAVMITRNNVEVFLRE